MSDPEDSSLLIQEIALRNILSYGPEAEPIPLGRLNVLIGPNSSGKSNLVEAIGLLRAAPDDLRTVIRKGGGITEWIWKGDPTGVAEIDVVVGYPTGPQPLRHVIQFRAANQGFSLEDESIEKKRPHREKPDTNIYYRYEHGHPVIARGHNQHRLAQETVEPDVSILAQRRDPETYPVVSYLASAYKEMRIYREWSFGRSAVFRQPQQADMPNGRLEEDFSNLGLFLNRMRRIPQTKHRILSALKDLYEGFEDFDVSVEGGTVQVFFTEGAFTIPANRLSDGTLRYLCLLAILCDPEPPPLICIEEPELGLHPDVIPKLAELMIDASERTQLIVTTHSDILVDALTEMPEAVLICEKHEGRTTMKRLEVPALEEWLKKYRLGQLWTKGELGGTRW